MYTFEYPFHQSWGNDCLQNDIWELSDFGRPIEYSLLQLEPSKMLMVPWVADYFCIRLPPSVTELLFNDGGNDWVIALMFDEVLFRVFFREKGNNGLEEGSAITNAITT